MPRLQHTQSGAVVSCSEETASRLGSEWRPADEVSVEEPTVDEDADRPVSRRKRK